MTCTNTCFQGRACRCDRAELADLEAAAATERRMFRPTYDIDGPHARKPVQIPFYLFLAAALVLALTFGAVLDRLGVPLF